MMHLIEISIEEDFEIWESIHTCRNSWSNWPSQAECPCVEFESPKYSHLWKKLCHLIVNTHSVLLCVWRLWAKPNDYHNIPVSEASWGSHEASLPLHCLLLQWMRHALKPEQINIIKWTGRCVERFVYLECTWFKQYHSQSLAGIWTCEWFRGQNFNKKWFIAN